MTNKLLIAGGLLTAFVAGIAVNNFRSSASAFAPPDGVVMQAPATTYQPVRRLAPATRQVVYQPAAQPVVQQQPVVYQEPQQVKRGRSWEREVLIVAGSSGAGAAIGAVAGGGKGAAIGAVSGGVAGLVYDIATRNK